MVRIKDKNLIKKLVRGQGHFRTDPVPIIVFWDSESEIYILIYHKIEEMDLRLTGKYDVLWTRQAGWIHEKSMTDYFGMDDKVLIDQKAKMLNKDEEESKRILENKKGKKKLIKETDGGWEE